MNKNVKKDYLSLNPYLDIDTVTKIHSIELNFDSMSVREKLSAIARCAKKYQGIVFYRDYKLAVLFALCHPLVLRRKKLVFHEFFCHQCNRRMRGVNGW